MKIAFIGIGNMGDGMARNLLAAGHTVTVFNRTSGPAEALGADGATVAASAAHAVAGAEVVLSMLADDAALAALFVDDPAVIEAMAGGTVHVSLATISVGMAARLRDTHAAAGQHYVSAPVFGRPPAAAAAKLFIVAAGQPAAIATAQPLFDVMGQRTFVVGEDPAAANVVKIAGNFMLASLIESFGEAFALTRKHGIAPDAFLEVMTGSIFPAPIHQIYGGMIASEAYEPAGFRLELGLKDCRLALDAADAVTVPLPLASLLRDQYLNAIAHGWEDIDWAGLARVSAAAAGLPPAAPQS